ncbi:MAG: hypothetical protein WA354_06315 [Terracidiphilus sp.]
MKAVYEGLAGSIPLRVDLGRKWNMHGAGRAVREISSGVVDLAHEHLAEIAGCLIIQAEVGVFFHDVESEAEIS